MSNGDDVLDNWEEIDEAGLNNTLQKIEAVRKTHNTLNTIKPESQLNEENISSTAGSNKNKSGQSKTSSASDFQPMKVLQRSPANSAATGGASTTTGASIKGGANSPTSTGTPKSPLDDMAATFHPVMMVLHKPTDEYQSANYMPAINSQTVKILRRPTQSNEGRNNGVKPKQPIKTLQQREQEYAEARLRIMGAAKNPEDDVAGGTNNNSQAGSTAGTATASAATATATSALSGNQARPKAGSGGGGGGNAALAYNNHYHHNNHQQQQQQQNFYYQQQQQQQQQQSQPAYNNRSSGAPPLIGHHPSQLVHQQHHHTSSPGPALLGACPGAPTSWSPIVGGNVSSPLLRQQQQQQPAPQPPPAYSQESVLRLPRGPDGSTGFQMRR